MPVGLPAGPLCLVHQISTNGLRCFIAMSTTASHETKIEIPGVGETSIPVGLFINNQWTVSSNNETLWTTNPATGQQLVPVSHACADDVERAVKAARKAFNTVWGNCIPATKRAYYLYKLADLMERDIDTLAALEGLNSGKPIRIARDWDITDSIGSLRYYAGLADKPTGQTIDNYGKEKFVYTIHQPIGVCGQIIPWNYPIQMWAWKVAPALAAGCTVIIKPSEWTPLTALKLCELVLEAGIPPGVVNVVPGLGKTTGAAIAMHGDIDKVAFTGSTAVGRSILAASAASNLKKVTLELGGKSPIVVMPSADIQEAAAWSAIAIWANMGQDCCAGSRVLVHESVYDQFVAHLVERASECKIGHPSDEETSFGPLISEAQLNKVLDCVQRGREEGATVVAGGKRWAPGGNGFWMEPTVIDHTNNSMTVVREEIFGPVVCVAKFKDEQEAIEIANDSVYGLAGAIFTNDARQATRMSRALNAGTVWINQYLLLDNGSPFGGFKQSGIGRELGTYGLEAYTQVKAVHQALEVQTPWPL